MCLLHINIRSLKKNFSDLLVSISSHLKHIDILVITEANINYSLIPLYSINGFNTNAYTRTGRSGGGVLVYSRTDLDARVPNTSTALTTNMRTAECVSIAFNYNDEQIYLISMYRPPRINNQSNISQFMDELRNLFHSLPKSTKVIYCGDININILNKHDNNVLIYENLLAEFGFIKCINDVTRREIIRGKVVESCLDHIYIRSPMASIDSAVIKHKISDHYYISAAIEWKQAPSSSQATRIVGPDQPGTRRVLDNRLVREKLLASNFDELLTIKCPVELYNAFSQMFVNIYNNCYSTKVVHNNSTRNNKSWITDNLKTMITKRDKLFEVWSNDPKNMIKRLNYTKYRNRCHKAITKCNNNHDRQSILDCNKNIKKIWDKIHTLMGTNKQPIDNLILNNMKEEGNIKEICNKFSTNFSDEVDKIKHVCNERWLDRKSYVNRCDVSMRWQPVKSEYVKNIIDHMDKNKSPGSDLVRMSDLKLVINKVSPVIARLANLSIESHIFPNKLKETIIRPIHKKGDRKKFNNYRPIAILSSIDKIIEKCITNQLGNYLSTNNILNKCQHGFQKGKSTNTLLTKFTNDINTYLEGKKFVIAIFFDFKKAFDTLETETLLNGMEECGVGGPLNRWFRDYLTTRSYRVKIGETFSDEKQVQCGVPQGSGCGPVCYLMHVNSLCGVLRHCKAYMFADDLCALRAGTNLADECQLIQQDVDTVVKWSHDNGIILNSDKTKLLIIHSPYLPLTQTTPSIYTHSFQCLHNKLVNCSCIPIERVNCVTYLGVKIDENFSWAHHIDYICNKLRILLGKFYHLSYKVPIGTLKCLYLALVDSVISYALDCYGLTFKTYIDKIENIQIRFLKLLVNKKTKKNCEGNHSKLFKICKILPVSLKHKYLLALNNHSNQETNLRHVIHNYGTRTISMGKYSVPKVKNYYGDRTLRKRLPCLLNSLPEDIRSEPYKTKFKNRLYKYLMHNL